MCSGAYSAISYEPHNHSDVFLSLLSQYADVHQRNWSFSEFVRVENIFNKEYVGSVRVADSQQKFYEAAPTRNWLFGLNAAYKF